jgi:general secretion pathway protein B
MSYILDALKKADTERERRAVPGLHAQADGGFGVSERRGGLPWGWLALGAIVLLIALVAWLWFGRREPSALASAPAPTPVPLAQAVPTPTPQPMPAPVAPPSPPPTLQPAPPPTQAPIAHMAPPPAPAAPAATPPAPKVAAAPASAAEPRIPSRNELPPELRASLPPLNVSGAVYAPQPAGRLLFVNGLVLREGDAMGDGLSVERIGQSSSVLVFRGQRFTLPH